MFDEQHHQQVDILNRLNAFIKDTTLVKQGLPELLKELSDYTKYHFSTEEKLMVDRGYGDIREHLAEHAFFIERIVLFRKAFESNDMNVLDEMLYFLMIWLQDHILIVDHKLCAFLNQGKVR